MHLYELTEQFKQLQSIDAEDSESFKLAMSETMDSIQVDFNEKAINLVKHTKNIDGDIAVLDSEIKRLQARKKALQNYIESFKDYLRSNMEATGISKIECPQFSITLGKPVKTVGIINEDIIPADYLNIKTVVTPIKADILKELKSGKIIPGCEISDSKSRLLIK